MKMKQDSLKSGRKKGSVKFSNDQKPSFNTSVSMNGAYINDGFDSDFGEDMSDFSGSHRSSTGQGRSSVQFEPVDEDTWSQV